MKRKRLDKWTVAERVIVITTGIIGAYVFVQLIIAIVNFIKVLH
jgi:hypothetical protein